MKRKRRKPVYTGGKDTTEAQIEKEVADFMEWTNGEGWTFQSRREDGTIIFKNAAGETLPHQPLAARFAIAVAGGWKPVNKEFLRLAAEDVSKRFPDGWGFILLAAPIGAGGRLAYVSNFDRSDAIKTLKEFLFTQGEEENWMKHTK